MRLGHVHRTNEVIQSIIWGAGLRARLLDKITRVPGRDARPPIIFLQLLWSAEFFYCSSEVCKPHLRKAFKHLTSFSSNAGNSAIKGFLILL